VPAGSRENRSPPPGKAGPTSAWGHEAAGPLPDRTKARAAGHGKPSRASAEGGGPPVESIGGLIDNAGTDDYVNGGSSPTGWRSRCLAFVKGEVDSRT
jgi:hypothetical protein